MRLVLVMAIEASTGCCTEFLAGKVAAFAVNHPVLSVKWIVGFAVIENDIGQAILLEIAALVIGMAISAFRFADQFVLAVKACGLGDVLLDRLVAISTERALHRFFKRHVTVAAISLKFLMRRRQEIRLNKILDSVSGHCRHGE